MSTDLDWAALWEQLLAVLGSPDRQASASGAPEDMQREWSELGAVLARQAAASLPQLVQASAAPWEALASMFAPAGAANQGAADATAKIFPFPPVGLFHKDQESVKRLHRAGAAFNDLHGQYHARLTGVLNETLRLLIERARQARDKQAPIRTARELYDSWVTVGESCFAKLAHEPAFCDLQARLLNSQSELRMAQQEVMELWLRHYGLPTRTDVEELHAQIATLRSQLAGRPAKTPGKKPAPPKSRRASAPRAKARARSAAKR